MFIVAILVLHVKENIQAAQRSYGQTNDVDETIRFISPQIAESCFKVSSNHCFNLKRDPIYKLIRYAICT
jgi:hypothetical protein